MHKLLLGFFRIRNFCITSEKKPGKIEVLLAKLARTKSPNLLQSTSCFSATRQDSARTFFSKSGIRQAAVGKKRKKEGGTYDDLTEEKA